MKYKDYYAILGVKRDAGADEIKTAYRRLARKYHPDVSKEKDAEEKFKEMAEAYETLKDPEKRAAYDQLGSHAAGQEFRPPPDWGQQFAQREGSFEDIDLSDLFAAFGQRGARDPGAGGRGPRRGHDYEAGVQTLLRPGVQRYRDLARNERSRMGRDMATAAACRARSRVRIPRGVGSGEKLRVPGKGGQGFRGGPAGDLYLDIDVEEHPLYRVSGTGHLRRPAARALGSRPWHQRSRCRRLQARCRSRCRRARAPDNTCGSAAADSRAARARPGTCSRWCASTCRPRSTTRSAISTASWPSSRRSIPAPTWNRRPRHEQQA